MGKRQVNSTIHIFIILSNLNRVHRVLNLCHWCHRSLRLADGQVEVCNKQEPISTSDCSLENMSLPAPQLVSRVGSVGLTFPKWLDGLNGEDWWAKFDLWAGGFPHLLKVRKLDSNFIITLNKNKIYGDSS